MWYNTRVTKMLGVQYPIFQGPFGGNFSTIELTATVSNAGGVGGYGAYTLSPDEIAAADKGLKQATDKPYNINLWVGDTDADGGAVAATAMQQAQALLMPYFEELGIQPPDKPLSFSSRFANQVNVILDVRPPVFSFVFGIPSADILEQCRKLGIITAGGATTLDEAIALEAAGVDVIVASGFEGGGHRPSFLAPAEQSLVGTFVLIQQIREKVRTPIIAAGGIANGRGIAAALALGADGVQVGTAFLACEESNALNIHREMLFSDVSRHSVLTRAFTGRLGRGLRSRISEEIRGKEQDLLPFPLQGQLMSSLRQAAIKQQQWELILFWSGQIAPVLKHRKAKELMEAMVAETTAYFDEAKQLS
ncbi:nitronate monooxygenase [Chitinophaga agrisoli]|uniref:Propionate 3-nitronate monooxygenase n=1 Tax=Chitinophaga agrisoli TaxID=2607653 RepID=A0A5B2VWT2_9BACT|nr:nitronate monooxygenase [Chitinophaga agrisoli]KAA2243545.1 nitronate monooxygenase [Chitinophaga agrisoli]